MSDKSAFLLAVRHIIHGTPFETEPPRRPSTLSFSVEGPTRLVRLSCIGGKRMTMTKTRAEDGVSLLYSPLM